MVGNAILGIDTLWGGDVMCASGTGRFIADSWFSDEPLPLAYTHPDGRAQVRESGGVSAKAPGPRPRSTPISRDVDVLGGDPRTRRRRRRRRDSAPPTSTDLALCFEVMWDLAMELLGKGEPVPYERCVLASTGRAAGAVAVRAASASAWRELLARAGTDLAARPSTPGARQRLVPMAVGARPRRCRHRTLRLAQRRQRRSAICPRRSTRCRAPTSSSCRSATPGSPVP